MSTYEIDSNEMYRTCSKCGMYKPLSEFSFLKTGRYCVRCKECNYNDYVKKNKEKNYFTVSKYETSEKKEEGIPKWILRNLKFYGNCCVNINTYDKYASEFDKIADIDNVDLENCYKLVRKKEVELVDD